MKAIDKKLVIIFSFYLLISNSFSQTNDSTFTSLDKALLTPLKVVILDLNNQNLSILPDDISKLENLQILNLNGNPNLDFKMIFHNLSSCKKIKELYLENNNLSTLPVEVVNLNRLNAIYLRNNKISSLPSEMKNLDLKYIDLGNNNMSDENEREIFKILPNTTTVNIAKIIPQEESKSLKYYEEGNKATSLGKLLLADSLYTLSINLQPNHDTYFNRAVVRKKLNNPTGYCLDLGSSSSLNDKEATQLYWKDCGTVDSVFYNKNGISVKKGGHVYCEITSKSKYTTYMRFKKIDLNNKIIAHFEVLNDDTIFYATPIPPKYSESEDNVAAFLIKDVVPTNKERKGVLKTIVIISFNVLKNGEIEEISAYSSMGKTYDDKIIEALKKQMKEWKPAKYEGKPVKYKKWIQYYLTF